MQRNTLHLQRRVLDQRIPPAGLVDSTFPAVVVRSKGPAGDLAAATDPADLDSSLEAVVGSSHIALEEDIGCSGRSLDRRRPGAPVEAA